MWDYIQLIYGQSLDFLIIVRVSHVSVNKAPHFLLKFKLLFMYNCRAILVVGLFLFLLFRGQHNMANSGCCRCIWAFRTYAYCNFQLAPVPVPAAPKGGLRLCPPPLPSRQLNPFAVPRPQFLYGLYDDLICRQLAYDMETSRWPQNEASKNCVNGMNGLIRWTVEGWWCYS